MRNLKKIKRLLKVAQEGSLEAWQQVKAEAESEALPPELDVSGVEESAGVAEDLSEKAEAARQSLESLTSEEKSTLQEASSEPGFIDKVIASGNIKSAASSIIDTLFLKAASKKIGKNAAAAIIRDINIYSSLENFEIKIASRNSFETTLIRKKEAFDRMLSDENFLKEASSKYLMVKNSNFMSGLAEGISGAAGAIGRGLKAALSGVWSFIWKVFPIFTLIYSVQDGYNSYNMVEASVKKVVSNFSDLGTEESLLDPEYISKLIEEFGNIPEKILRVTRLNKIAIFYKKHWYNMWYSVASAIEDIISIILTFFTAGVATVATRVASIVSTILGFGSFFGSLGTSFLDIGVSGYVSNNKTISTIAGTHISELKSDMPSESDLGELPADNKREEALRTFRLLQDSMSAAKALS